MSFLTPGIDVFNVNPNILTKMFPILHKQLTFDKKSTLCYKLNSGCCNLKIIKFDRFKIYTLDRWLFEMLEHVLFFEKIETKNEFEYPTPYFEDQKITDCMCMLLYLIDEFLDKKTIKLSYKDLIFMEYKSHFSIVQQQLLLKILIIISRTFESNELKELENTIERTSTTFLVVQLKTFTNMLSRYIQNLDINPNNNSKSLDYYTNKKKKNLSNQTNNMANNFLDYTLNLIINGTFRFNFHTSLYENFYNFCVCENLSQASEYEYLIRNSVLNYNCDTNVYFIPIQNNLNMGMWLKKRKISQYNTRFVTTAVEKLKFCSQTISQNLPLIVFGLSDPTSCRVLFCIYNKFTFEWDTTNESFDSWLHSFFNFDENACFSNIAVQNSCNIQDFLLIIEMHILRYKFKRILKSTFKVMKSMPSKKRPIVLWDPYKLVNWPFNKKIFYSYMLFYIIAYHMFNQPAKIKKGRLIIKLNTKHSTPKHAWNKMLKNVDFSRLDVNLTDFYTPSYITIENN